MSTIHPGIFLGRALWADCVFPRMNTTASRDQFKPISIGENLVVNYLSNMKDVLYEVRCLKSNEDMIQQIDLLSTV